MLDRRLILGGLPAGLVLGALVWLVADRGNSQIEALDIAVADLQRMTPTSARRPGATRNGLQGPPLFGQANSEALGPEPTLVLQGIVRTSRRHAALIAINGKPAEWLSVGETRDGITMQDVSTRGVTVSSANGVKEIGLGSTSSPSVTAPTSADPAAGFRSPPAPASAPASS